MEGAARYVQLRPATALGEETILRVGNHHRSRTVCVIIQHVIDYGCSLDRGPAPPPKRLPQLCWFCKAGHHGPRSVFIRHIPGLACCARPHWWATSSVVTSARDISTSSPRAVIGGCRCSKSPLRR